MLNARRLEVLEAVAAQGSFSAAAGAMDYTQSAVSQHIAALEREVGVTLVQRTARPVALTDAGAQLLEDAIPGLEHLARAERRLRELTELRAGRVRLGAFPSAHVALVPPALAAFRARHPEVEIVLEEGEPSAMLSALRSGTLDLAVVYTLPGREHPFLPPIALRALTEDALLVVLPPGHRLARRRAVRLAELADEPWIAAKRPNDFRDLFDELCNAAGFEPHIAVETRDPGAGAALAQAGIGAILVPALGLRTAPQTVAVAVRGIPPARTLCVATVSGRRHPAVTALSDALARAARNGSRRLIGEREGGLR
jgi:DNA-binding transcriptional LysR family regulator